MVLHKILSRSANLDELFELHETFEEKIICSELRPILVLWNSFMEMVKILRDFIKSTRTGDCKHLNVCENGSLLIIVPISRHISLFIELLTKKLRRLIQRYMTNLCLETFQ